MTAIVLPPLLFVACLLALLRQRKSSAFACAIAFAMYLGIGYGAVPGWLLSNLQTDYTVEPIISWDRKAAIILLGAGTEYVAPSRSVEVGALAYGRLVKTLELYRDCKQHGGTCIVIVSGGDAQHHGESEAAVYGSRLRNLGIDSDDLVIEGRSMNTWQNADFCAAWLNTHPVDQTVLVSSGLHLKRSLLYFSHFGIRATAVRGDFVQPISGVMPTTYNFFLTDLALHEYIGVWRYHVYQLLGWNIAAKHPGSV